MAGGCIDLYTSRRTNFFKCKYWVRNDNDYDLEELTHNDEPSGSFYAKEENSIQLQSNVVNGAFMFDEQSVFISTTDVVSMKKGDAVLFDGEYWNVINVQVRDIHRNSQFMKRKSKKTYIQLKR